MEPDSISLRCAFGFHRMKVIGTAFCGPTYSRCERCKQEFYYVPGFGYRKVRNLAPKKDNQ